MFLANPNPCRLPMSTGDGLANLERYYYDSATKSCRLFYYRGFKGNQNNFLTIVNIYNKMIIKHISEILACMSVSLSTIR